MPGGPVQAIESSVRALLARRNRLVLAVSGGADSSVLLDAVARLRTPGHRIVVASVDHGTGEAATEATARTAAMAATLGLPAVTERLAPARHDEASWREGRWSFLNRVAAREAAPVVTAHTRDDHIETVVMRILRGSGARGLAGLHAASPVERPLLGHTRREVLDYARRRGVEYLEDPTNTSRAFLRNRIRLDLLPAIRAVRSGFDRELLRLSADAARIRTALDACAPAFIHPDEPGALIVLDAIALSELADEALRAVLPAVLASAGIMLDRRGLQCLARLVRSAPGSQGQLSGGLGAVRSRRDLFVMHRETAAVAAAVTLPLSGEVTFGGFRFQARPIPAGRQFTLPVDPWILYIQTAAQLVVRQWHPGDRLTIDLMGGRRRVKRFFADAGIVGPLRAGWPVAVKGDEVVWIPGVRSTQAAFRREEALVEIRCERVRA